MKFLLVVSCFLLLFSFSTAVAKCPCASFDVYYGKLIGGGHLTSLEEVSQLLACLNCREKLGLHIFLCDVSPEILLAWPKIMEKFGYTNSDLIDLADESKDKCEDDIKFDIDEKAQGKLLVRVGVPLVILGCGLSVFTPAVIKWGFQPEFQNLWFFGTILYLVKIFLSVVYGVAGGFSLVGGTTMIVVGNNKFKEYQMYTEEKKFFLEDLKKTGIITVIF